MINPDVIDSLTPEQQEQLLQTLEESYEKLGLNFEMRKVTMLGDLMQFITDKLKQLPKPWQELTESEQKDYIGNVEFEAEHVIRSLVRIISANNFESTGAVVESVTFKNGVKGVLQLRKGEAAHSLAEHEGQAVTIVFADPEDFLSSEGKPKADKDQPDLELVDNDD